MSDKIILKVVKMVWYSTSAWVGKRAGDETIKNRTFRLVICEPVQIHSTSVWPLHSLFFSSFIKDWTMNQCHWYGAICHCSLFLNKSRFLVHQSREVYSWICCNARCSLLFNSTSFRHAYDFFSYWFKIKCSLAQEQIQNFRQERQKNIESGLNSLSDLNSLTNCILDKKNNTLTYIQFSDL